MPLEEIVVAPASDDEPRTRARAWPKLLCVDLVEDQQRSRIVVVFMALAMYLVVGADLIKFSPTQPFEDVSRIVDSSLLPAAGRLGPLDETARKPSFTVISTLGKGFVNRRCPSVANASACESDSEYTEPVVLSARVHSLSYDVKPKVTIQCDTHTRDELAGTLDGVRRDEACRAELVGASNRTDDKGTALLSELAVASGPPVILAVRSFTRSTI